MGGSLVFARRASEFAWNQPVSWPFSRSVIRVGGGRGGGAEPGICLEGMAMGLLEGNGGPEIARGEV